MADDEKQADVQEADAAAKTAKAAPKAKATEPEPEPAPTRADTTVPGGRYVVNGQTVDANGKPIKE